MPKESKKLVDLLKKAQVDEALEYAGNMKNTTQASEVLSDFASSVVMHLNDYETAELLLKRAVAINPKNAEAFYNLGVLYTEPGLLVRDETKLVEAEKAYLKALKIRPDFMEAHYNLALLYHIQGRVDEADLEQSIVAESCEEKEIAEGLKKILSRKRKKFNPEKDLD